MTMNTFQASAMRAYANHAPAVPPPLCAAGIASHLDIDALLANLPPWGPVNQQYTEEPNRDARGYAGQRLRAGLRAQVSDELLREMACETLGARRCSQQYLEALRVVLGNQAHAERVGYLLEMNVRTSFTSERTMRTILDQMTGMKGVFRKQVVMGAGRTQAVHCYYRPRHAGSAEEELNRMYRAAEGYDCFSSVPSNLAEEDVPY